MCPSPRQSSVISLSVPNGSAAGLAFGVADGTLIVSGVEKGSPAHMAGLRPGLLLTSLDGQETPDSKSFVTVHGEWRHTGSEVLEVGVSVKEVLEVGEPCEAFSLVEESGEWMKGTVAKVRGDGRYDVVWDEDTPLCGTKSKKMLAAHVRPPMPEMPEQSEPPPPAALRVTHFQVEGAEEVGGTTHYKVSAATTVGRLQVTRRYNDFRKLREHLTQAGFGPGRLESPFPGKTLGKAGPDAVKKRTEQFQAWLSEAVQVSRGEGRKNRGGLTLEPLLFAFADPDDAQWSPRA
eukprot:TRINITY_DN47119_c0_g1_i1.p1 TRINITY_DN47119_c0_g1~~TRINITY_DN47119_c0_g1_i1.p1  ORF type:complete len:312 (+),score=92.65 TRINITY_DN47119_c0_g1_i1:66-938(+)